MSNINYIHTKNPQRKSANLLSSLLEKNRVRPILLLLSGGSALSILNHVDTSALSKNITLSVLDERFSNDKAVNNFAQIMQTDFFDLVFSQGVHIISTIQLSPSQTTLHEAGKKFDRELRMWKEINPTGIVIATMGIGSDGHTAGLFPGIDKKNLDGTSWVCAYSVTPQVNQHTQRISVTYNFLRDYVDEALVYAVGKEKESLVENILAKNCHTKDVPACIFHEMKRITLISDH